MTNQNLFDDAVTETESPEPEPVDLPAPDAPEAPPAPDSGTGEKPASPPDAIEARIRGLEQALSAERHKRQEAEARTQERQSEQKASTEITDDEYYADPVGAMRRMRAEILAGNEQAMFQQRVALSVAAAKRSYTDYDTVVSHFNEIAKDNAILHNMVRSDVDPAGMAYRLGKQDLEARELRDPSVAKARIDAEVNRRVAEELARRTKADVEGLPPSMSQSGTGSKGQPVPIDDEFERAFARNY